MCGLKKLSVTLQDSGTSNLTGHCRDPLHYRLATLYGQFIILHTFVSRNYLFDLKYLLKGKNHAAQSLLSYS